MSSAVSQTDLEGLARARGYDPEYLSPESLRTIALLEEIAPSTEPPTQAESGAGLGADDDRSLKPEASETTEPVRAIAAAEDSTSDGVREGVRDDSPEPQPAGAGPEAGERLSKQAKSEAERPAPALPLNGYVLLHRRLLDHPIWLQLPPSVLKLFVGFLLLANWRPRRWYDGEREIEIPRGDFVTSYARMASTCGLTIKQTRAGFAHLRRAGIAAYTRARRYTIVTVLNYETYQPAEHDRGTVEGTDQGTAENGDQGTDEGRMRARCGHEVGQQLNKERSKEQTHGEIRRVFDAEFWPLYPRKVGKPAALRVFAKKITNGAAAREIVAGLKVHLPELVAREVRYIPHATTWLNEERWTDPVEQSGQSATSHKPSLYVPPEGAWQPGDPLPHFGGDR